MKPLYFVIDGIRVLGIYQKKEEAKEKARVYVDDNLIPPGDVKIYSVNCGEVEYG